MSIRRLGTGKTFFSRRIRQKITRSSHDLKRLHRIWRKRTSIYQKSNKLFTGHNPIHDLVSTVYHQHKSLVLTNKYNTV